MVLTKYLLLLLVPAEQSLLLLLNLLGPDPRLRELLVVDNCQGLIHLLSFTLLSRFNSSFIIHLVVDRTGEGEGVRTVTLCSPLSQPEED